MSHKDMFERLIELVKDDEELHEAIIIWIRARALAQQELAEWRKRRK